MTQPRPVWGRVDAARSGWRRSPLTSGSAVVLLEPIDDATPPMLQLEMPPHAAVGPYRFDTPCLAVVLRGAVEYGAESTCGPEDLRWCGAGHAGAGFRAGAEGAALLLVGTQGALSIDWGATAGPSSTVCKRVGFADVTFVDFPDDAGRDTQPVQALFTDDPYLLRTRFAPDFVAGEHWHDFDTVYFVLAGSMQFGPQEPVYHRGDLRWVRGGHAYGPEQPGAEGVEFLLLSCGGPVSLHWADLKPAPKGRIAPLAH